LLSGVGSSTLKYDGDAIRQKFTGKQRDNETNLDYFEARYYSSRWGRFTNPDEFTGGPEELIEFDGMKGHNPTFYAELAEPQSLNKYQYALNNPLRYIDPDGHQSRTADRIYAPTYPIVSKKDADAIGREIEDIGNTIWEGFKTIGRGIQEGAKKIQEGIRRDGLGSCPFGNCVISNNNQMADASTEAKVSGQTSADSSTSQKNNKNKPVGKSSSGQNINSKGQKLGPSGKPVVHNVRPSTRKQALDSAKNKKGSTGTETHKKDKFEGKRVDTHVHSVDKDGKKIDNKTHIFLPKKNQPPKDYE
jgi:RHS repeat-associated protein